VLYHNTDPQRELIDERVELLRDEMRHARRLMPEEAGYPKRIARELLRRAEFVRGRKVSHGPALNV
jgi:hypothetical protein